MKKVLIFSSYGGGGHVSVANAVTQYIKDTYNVKSVFIFDEVLGYLDPMKVVTFGLYSSEKSYNVMLRNKWTWLVNLLYLSGRTMMPIINWLVKRIVISYLVKDRPDIVISVVPLVNNVLKSACDDLSIPFLLIPTDLDPTTFIYNLKRPYSKNMHISLPFDDIGIWDTIASAEIPYYQVSVCGFPLRKNFFEQKDTNAIRADFNIKPDKKVIMILMGAAGSTALINYVRTLSLIDIPVHLLICLGRSEELRTEIEAISIPDHISLTIIGQTDRIADLIAVSDLYITKAGTVSVCEGIYSEVPMILDNTSTALRWEAFNLKFIEREQFGLVNHSFSKLNDQVKKILVNESYHDFLKTNLQNYPKKYFGSQIKDLLKAMLSFN